MMYPADPRVDAYLDATARTVAVRAGESLNTRALGAMFARIIANNRAGGWRRLKRQRDSGWLPRGSGP